MSGKRYTEQFKIAAVKPVAPRGHPVSEVAERLKVSIHSLYASVKRYGVPEEERKAVDAQSDEMRRLKAELKRVTESWIESGSVYVYRTVSDDLRELREQCGINRVHRLMRQLEFVRKPAALSANISVAAHLRWWRPIICSVSSTCRNRIVSG